MANSIINGFHLNPLFWSNQIQLDSKTYSNQNMFFEAITYDLKQILLHIWLAMQFKKRQKTYHEFYLTKKFGVLQNQDVGRSMARDEGHGLGRVCQVNSTSKAAGKYWG